ncbi:alpha/beta fold hydrolase [Lichenihabitans psoromatis]|uniref:alpha/beta fold hydrolase n=1 Tax=Lichenihabitans psoromatis TaxID=2528642 RepID=UPI0010385D11|nr:alpha/beta hydrolase [Lichenihabitans psoromatis]
MPPPPDTFVWIDQAQRLDLSIERRGQGPTLLMLPALSSISTLGEMQPLQDRLSDRFQTVALDWPGFGTRPRPKRIWDRKALQTYLDVVLDTVVERPLATLAAGHAAGYLLDAAMRRPGLAGRLVLLAPTWRGPLPTMMGRRSRLGERVGRAAEVPLLGSLLYRLNLNPPMVRLMARQHVYTDPTWLSGDRLAAKMRVVNQTGARHASLRFVAGLLDPFDDHEAFLTAATLVRDPILVVYGDQAPSKSKAEMAALSALPHVETIVLRKGKLALHEEWPDEVAAAIRPFLSR